MGSVARAVTALTFLAVTGLVLVVVLGRPTTVDFTASFKCERLSLGSRLDLPLTDCNQLAFRAPCFWIPRDYAKDLLDPDAKNSQNDIKVKVLVYGDVPVTVDIDENDATSGVGVTLDSDSYIELQPPKTASKLCEFRVLSEKLRISVKAVQITLTAPCEPDFTGFYDPDIESTIGSISMDGWNYPQAGSADSVYVDVPDTVGAVRIRGNKDEIAGWNPISVQTGPAKKPLELAPGRFWAEKISSCAVSINGESVDIATAVERLQIDIVKASVDRLALYEDDSEGYITITVSGAARSIKQNNKEVIESVMSRLLSQPSYKTGIAGLCLIFVVFAGGIFLKRALDVLAETWLP